MTRPRVSLCATHTCCHISYSTNSTMSLNIIGHSQNRSDNTKTYIGLTEGTFKQRFYGHTSSFRHEKQEKSTGLSKYIWQRKRANEKYSIEWSVLRQAPAYSNITKKCDLCLTEKLMISSAEKKSSLNTRSELVSKCRHENKYLLRNLAHTMISYFVTYCS